MIGKYARLVSDVDLGWVRVSINGGEPVDCAAMERFADALSAFGFDAGALAPSYGLAESTCAVTIPVPGTGLLYDEVPSATADSDALGPRRHAILGAPIAGMEIRIGQVAERSAELPDRDVGEIEIRGTSMMSGYVGDTPLGSDAWFPTGDLGYLTDDGRSCAEGPKKSSPSRAATFFPPRSSGSPRKPAACAKVRWWRWVPTATRRGRVC